MAQIHGDYLAMYDPNHTEQHSDSSDFDFDEHIVPLISKKRRNFTTQNHDKILKRTKNTSYLAQDYSYDQYPVKLKRKRSHILLETKAVQVSKTKTSIKQNKKEHKELKPINRNCGDRPEPVQSKLSLIRQKVIPCLSNIFRKSHTKHDIINEYQEDALDNCKRCSNCERRQMKKFIKRQNYAVQPVFAIGGNIHKAPVPITPTTEPLKHNRKKTRNQYSSCSVSSSSESETLLSEKMKQKTMKMRNRFKKELMKEHWKYQQRQHLKNQRHHYPSKDHKFPYQVFSSPYQHSRTNISPSDSQYTTEMPASSSGFWEYLFDKINRKYQIQKMEMPKPCQCSSSSSSSAQLPCSTGHCDNFEIKPDLSFCKGRQSSPLGNSCSCASKQQPRTNGCCKKNDALESLPPLPAPMAKNSFSFKIKPQKEKKDIECKCSDKGDTTQSRASRIPSKSQAERGAKPCQEGHDEITRAVAEKYNGEILCIHNPPCILINGCLNLPPQKDPQQQQQQMNFWPVTETKKSGFNNKKKASKNSKLKSEQACQYHVPFIEVRQCQTPEYKTEKNIQSICHHNPPCEVVRGCYKPKFDPRLQTSCIHVPMCQNMPECVIGTSAAAHRSCEHRPRCPDIPLCSRNYTCLTARESFGAQVKPKFHLVCRHKPPCIMIPKCLGRAVYESYLPYDAVPECIHQPICDMIPACCRKSTKEMVSVSSQYPNACRIV